MRGCIVMCAAVLAACDSDSVGPRVGSEPRELAGQYAWVLERWTEGSAEGFGTVELAWRVPTTYNQEPFRLYARPASAGSYVLVATVTSCSEGICRYTDTNIVEGQSYEYFVATLDERDGVEIGSTEAINVDVPLLQSLDAPAAPTAISLDNAVYLQWGLTGAERYLVLVQVEGEDTFLIGESDGGGFFDNRAENGVRYTYFIAAADQQGHTSSLSPGSDAFPRPDYYADVVFAASDLLASSGFRFPDSETEDPILPGDSPSAHWRLDLDGGVLHIEPLGATAVTGGAYTSQLTCGPGADFDCADVRTAPESSEFDTTAVPVEPGFTYVFRVTGSDDETHFAKLRVQGESVDSEDRRLIVFDWAYQVRPDEPSLNWVR